MKQNSVILKKGKEVIFKNRHLWIFSGAIFSFPDHFNNGSIQAVSSYDGKLLGYAYFNKNKSLCGRIISIGSKDPYLSIKEHIQQAISMRHSFFNTSKTNSYRLINGEGDFIPGLIVDCYDNHLVLQSSTLGIDLLKDFIVECLTEAYPFKAIFEKSITSSRKEEGLQDCVTTLYGETLEEFAILENGLQFQVHWKKGQKTGFFLDQREMRSKVKGLSQNKKVLNCFSYTGGFSIYALAGHAAHVDSVDISDYAIQTVQENLLLNHFTQQNNQCIRSDVFDFLSQQNPSYDFIILDPPAFAKKKKDIEPAIKAYRNLNKLAFHKLPKNSFLLTSSCSYYISEKMFQELIFQAGRETHRDISIISKHLQAIDHPISLFHPESDYLKSLLLYVH